MKSVLISINPKWCELIANGEKTLEVRKTRPKIKTPFKCYIYCTAGVGKNTFNVPVSAEKIARHYAETGSMECLNCPIGNQKVIGEFVCDRVYQYSINDNLDGVDISTEDAVRMSCLTKRELEAYEFSAEPKDFCLYMVGLYFWHISNLKIYDKPKELGKFRKSCGDLDCDTCPFFENTGEYAGCLKWEELRLRRPPQSWCYVEEI